MFSWIKVFRKNNTSPFDFKKSEVSIQERLKALRNLPKFFKLVWNISPRLTILNLFLRLVRAFQPLAILYVAKLIMDMVVMMVSQKTIVNGDDLVKLILIECGLAILNDVLGRSIALTDGLLGDKSANETSIKLMEHAARLDMYHFEDSKFYDKLERARRQTLSRSSLMAQMMGQLQESITLIVLAIGIASFNPWLILLLLVAVLPAFLGESHFNEKSYSLLHGWTPERRELDYLRYTGSSDENAKEVKMFGLSAFIIQRYKLLSEKFYIDNKMISLKRAFWGSILTALATFAHYSTYGYIVYKTINGELTIGDFTFFIGSFSRMRVLLDNIFARFSSMAESALYLEDLFSFFELKANVASPKQAVKFPDKIIKGFTFENVGYRYPNSNLWAIRNLSFHLAAGEKLALVGENGAGKTTIVKLLARLYDPNEGRILVDGVDIKDFDLEDLRSQIGVIFQDFVKYQMTASTNIAIGRIEEKENHSRISTSANQSLADTVIDKLPLKYDQIIGKRFANGVDLSGGEWQKIALARAYMRDAQLIILDEPTAALDAKAEHEVFQRFSELTKGKTAVLISHRFSTVRMADRILVIEKGTLSEIGTHEVLMNQNGRYAELFRLQAKGYQ
ncbi:MAG: ABC transporter ATP-binding protein [Cytophagales bacterium]|nr:MAG: ABC transporter ATP-binding protein [Cytophagales bacterium]